MTVSTDSTEPVDREHLKGNLKGIKICRISTVPFYVVSQLKTQVEYMTNIGMNVVLVSSDGPELSGIRLCDGLSHEVVEISRSLSPRKDLVAFIKLIRIFRKYKFDIVHSTTPKAGLLTSMAGLIARVPARLHTWTGQQWVTLKGAMRWICRLADKVIGILDTRCYADSKSQRQFLIDEGIVDSKKIAVLGHGSLAGVDLNRFDPAKWSFSDMRQLRQELSISAGSTVLIFVGRISREKGVLELISAFGELVRIGYDVDLLLLGPLDQDRGGSGSIDFSDIGQCPRTHYVGYTDCPERYLAISDILCLPSYREGFGTVVIEAAAMGVPTIGTRINGLIDAIVDGETGVLVPAHDDQALFRALRRLLDDPDGVHRMARAARERCARQFDANIVNRQVVKEYERIFEKMRY